MTRSEPPAEVVEDVGKAAIDAADELGPIGNADSYEDWCRYRNRIAGGAAIQAYQKATSLRVSSSLGGIEGGVARPQTASAPDEPLITGNAIGDIAAERRRQVEVEGWSPEHDDEHPNGEMAMAAVCYALSSADSIISPNTALGALWPWAREWWKPTKPRRDLVKSAALIVAEIERLDRAAKRSA